jgi:hypothetical protein
MEHMSRNKCFSQFRVSHVSHFHFDLFTDSPMYLYGSSGKEYADIVRIHCGSELGPVAGFSQHDLRFHEKRGISSLSDNRHWGSE